MKTEKPNNPNDIWAYWKMLLDERVRGYVVIAGAALLVIFVAQLMSGSLIAGLIPLLIGLLALGLRWSAMPLVCILGVAWLQAFPFGVPVRGPLTNFDPSRTHFRIPDLMLVAASMVYLIAQYRVYSLAHRALPEERPRKHVRAGDLREKRDPSLIDDAEIPRIFIAMAVVVFAGQILWFLLSELRLDFAEFPPIRPRPPAGERNRSVGSFPPTASRWLLFVISTGLLLFVTRLVLWYWRLRTLYREEAQLIMADMGWAEMRREAARQETWRAWGIRRAQPKEPPKIAPKVPKKPWLGKVLSRSCFLVFVAIVAFIVIVCAGAAIISWVRPF